uniref:Kazal-like domain-containing protein n=1 Tax=Hucho hucho TaxID=62062 RepID=A0A4W5PD68_9TELE
MFVCILNVVSLYQRQCFPMCYNYQLPGCPFNFEPVCGSNGVTYANECVLCDTIRETRRKILIVKCGPC